MVECKKEYNFSDVAKDVFSYVFQIISAGIFPKIAEGANMVMTNVEQRIIRIEQRILRKISHFLIISFGGIFLIFGLFFFLIETLDWSKALAFFSIGITIFVIGSMLNLVAMINKD